MKYKGWKPDPDEVPINPDAESGRTIFATYQYEGPMTWLWDYICEHKEVDKVYFYFDN